MPNLDPFFQKDTIFEYNEVSKKLNCVLLFLSFALILIIGSAFLFLNMEALKDYIPFIEILENVLFEIKIKSAFGLMLTGFFGGLFFLFFPLEIYFFSILTSESQAMNYLFPYIFGVTISQMTNYWLGLRLNRISKLMIPAKNFYKMKGLLNQWGIWMILIMNSIPLPSPVFSTVLGAFRYNFKKFFIFMVLGVTLLYTCLFLIYFILHKFHWEIF